MSETSHQNSVAERRNCTLKNMIMSMITHTTLLESLWSETLKMTVYLLDKVPNKIIAKTPHKL